MDIIDFNHCHHKNGCDCGWNVTFGGKSEVELMKLKVFVKEMVKNDLTEYSKKLGTEPFLYQDDTTQDEER
ncbi:MAG: hypothetical protein [Siphoviridae sp. ctCJE6]|nr:MAG: hypothetical protein [Siphoviridae sp. ctCJE6]